MGKIKLTSEMLRRIEEALDERKGDRRARAEPSGPERRRRADRRAAGAPPAAEAEPGTPLPAD